MAFFSETPGIYLSIYLTISIYLTNHLSCNFVIICLFQLDFFPSSPFLRGICANIFAANCHDLISTGCPVPLPQKRNEQTAQRRHLSPPPKTRNGQTEQRRHLSPPPETRNEQTEQWRHQSHFQRLGTNRLNSDHVTSTRDQEQVDCTTTTFVTSTRDQERINWRTRTFVTCSGNLNGVYGEHFA